MELFKKGNSFKGVFSQPTDQTQSEDVEYEIELKINDSTGDIFEGNILIKDCITKVKGKNSFDSVYFVEYEIAKGSGISFPSIYEGKIIGNCISGLSKHANYFGTFYLEMKDDVKVKNQLTERNIEFENEKIGTSSTTF